MSPIDTAAITNLIAEASTISPIDTAAIADLLAEGPYRTFEGQKQLTLAFGDLYIASTTASARPLLVWETEKAYYARYYVPTKSLHSDIKAQLDDSAAANGDQNGHEASSVKLELVESIKSKGSDSQGAVIERLTVDSRTTNWVRFLEGPLKGLIRFERNEIGKKHGLRCIFSYGRAQTAATNRNNPPS